MIYKIPMDNHHDAVTEHHRFASLTVGDNVWDFEHLEAFAIRVNLPLNNGATTDIDVIVLFSNHCFTRSLKPGEAVGDPSHIIMDGNKIRVLDEERYKLSREYLPHLIRELPKKHIQVADPHRPNFVTFELAPIKSGAAPLRYAVFFEVKKDTSRKKRMLLRVQTAYILENPTKRLLKAEKMNFNVVLKRAFL